MEQTKVRRLMTELLMSKNQKVWASIGVPLFAPFISEILTIISALFSDLSLIIKIIAILSLPLLIVSSCYMLKFLHNGFMGDIQEKYNKINDITVHEFVVLATLTFLLLLFGVMPSIILGAI